ncbi:unnamed protein product [Soboliphyme baturini]|uniref:Hcy-binding domain-containing protein n=1 Tax=Soboliphyme baturini TaxID=241478 RepID=A0A183IFB7_9BILA|nr:unnamed protein product [Soboliphyme baturini]
MEQQVVVRAHTPLWSAALLIEHPEAIVSVHRKYCNGIFLMCHVRVIATYYRDQASALIEANVDCLALETIPSLTEARLAIDAISKLPPVPLWISFSCKNGSCTNSGDEFSDVVSELCLNSAVSMIGINCTDPSIVGDLLKHGAYGMKPFVVYPNSGEKYCNGRYCL